MDVVTMSISIQRPSNAVCLLGCCSAQLDSLILQEPLRYYIPDSDNEIIKTNENNKQTKELILIEQTLGIANITNSRFYEPISLHFTLTKVKINPFYITKSRCK